MTDAWRRIPQRERPYDAYRRPRYLVQGCDHAGPYCKCDPPYHLRASTAVELAHEGRLVELDYERLKDFAP